MLGIIIYNVVHVPIPETMIILIHTMIHYNGNSDMITLILKNDNIVHPSLTFCYNAAAIKIVFQIPLQPAKKKSIYVRSVIGLKMPVGQERRPKLVLVWE